ncbi:MAG: response regulator [Candidatus Omnitrophica bacterium]|nr:response regulator [Candidatus Omnitrophota bacterium]MBI3020850.1 response regulator [Candidatus Omnitrophota bacterium]
MNAEPQRKRILIIDDTRDILQILSRRLQSWGYEVLTTESGEEGLRIAKEQAPHLILLDVMMPKMKGREVCARLKSDPKTQKIPVIFLTALGLADHVKGGMDLGAEDYIVKPFEPEELKERVAVCLARHENPT